MEKNEYLESLNNFYSLKHKYENNLKNSKYALIQNKDMTKEEKRNKFLKRKNYASIVNKKVEHYLQ